MFSPKTALVSAAAITAVVCSGLVASSPAVAVDAGVTIYVSPDGDDSATGGSGAEAFASLNRAQVAVREANASSDVTVVVGDGVYRLDAPLEFGVDDGGQGDHVVTWKAAPGAEPVISGGRAVEDWSDPGTGIWQADLDSDFDFRQLYVDGRQATRSNVIVDANKVTWSRTGFSVDPAYLGGSLGPLWSQLSALSATEQGRVELRSRGSFTDRIAPVLSFGDASATMQQPSWDNNTWGWDTIDKPLPDNSHRTLRIQNALALVDESGEWFFDMANGTLHYKPEAGVDPNALEIVAPMEKTLMSVSGEGADEKVANLRFEGLSFEYASDTTPSTEEGFANQQNGTYIAGRVYALVDPETGDLPTSDQRVFDGAEQAPAVRLIRLADDLTHRYIDDDSAVNTADLPRLINLRDYPNLPLNSTQLATWNAANPDAQKADCSRPVYPDTCQAFEANRGLFLQSSAAVQVSAAENISFTGNTFAHIGANALGIGNDATANTSGVGLGAQDVSIVDNTFVDIAGIALVAGGVSTQAHHPDAEGDRNARITITDNRISEVGTDYFDRSGILISYFDGAEVAHNELSKGAYDAIDSGWGWGVYDAGGNPTYQGRGAYLFNTRYADDAPTINRNIHIAKNVMWDFKQEGSDGGILYNLGAAPGSSWDSNYVMGDRGYKLYFDEGTRYMTAKDNVLAAGGTWTFANGFADGSATPAKGQPNTTRDNFIDGTVVQGAGYNQGPWCYDSGACDPDDAGRYNNRIGTRSQIGVPEFPFSAQQVIAEAGIRPEYRRPGDWIGEPRGLDLAISRDETGAQVLTATIANFGSEPLTSVTAAATASTAITLTPISPAPAALAPGATGTATWRVSGGAEIADGTVSVSTTSTAGGDDEGSARRTLPVVVGGAIDPALRTAGFGAYVAPQAVQNDGTIALQSSGRDIGEAGDEFTTVYSPDGLGVDGSVTTRLDAVEGSFYRSGLSVRNDLSMFADAAVAEKSAGYATLVAEPGWVAFRVDQNGDGVIDTQVDQAGVSARPLWLRIARAGNILTASYSTNGSTFTELGGKAQLVGADAGALDAGVVHSSADRTSVYARNALTTSTAMFSGLTFVGDSRTPVITLGREPAGVVGVPYSLVIPATNAPTFSLTDGALPDGLSLSASGTISGTPTKAGSFAATVEARSPGGAASTPVRIVVRAVAPSPPAVSVPSQEPAAPGLSTGGAEIRVQNPTPDATAYAVVVKNAEDAVVHSATITADAGAHTSTWAEGLGAGTYVISVIGDDGSEAVTEELTVVDGAFDDLPSPWESSHQGGATSPAVGVDGRQIAVLQQRSSDISGENATKSDSYSTVYRPDIMGADDSVQVTVTGQQRVGDFTKSGLIIRDDLSVSTGGSTGASNGSGSSSGEALLVLTPTRGIRFSVESADVNWYAREIAATTAWNVAQTITTPVTLRLTRQNGTTLVASYSRDGGATFQVLGTRAGFFASAPDAKLDAGVVHAANGGTAGGASTAAFRDLIVGSDAVAPELEATASASDIDDAADGAAQLVITNPSSRVMAVDLSATGAATGGVAYRSGVTVEAGGSLTVIAPRLPAGDYEITARDRATGAAATAAVTIAAAEGARFTPSVTTRCVAGKAHLAVSVRNDGDTAVAVTIDTPYGTKTIATVQPGKTASGAFATRLASMPEGSVTVTVSIPSGAASTQRVAYAASTCR